MVLLLVNDESHWLSLRRVMSLQTDKPLNGTLAASVHARCDCPTDHRTLAYFSCQKLVCHSPLTSAVFFFAHLRGLKRLCQLAYESTTFGGGVALSARRGMETYTAM